MKKTIKLTPAKLAPVDNETLLFSGASSIGIIGMGSINNPTIELGVIYPRGLRIKGKTIRASITVDGRTQGIVICLTNMKRFIRGIKSN